MGFRQIWYITIPFDSNDMTYSFSQTTPNPGGLSWWAPDADFFIVLATVCNPVMHDGIDRWRQMGRGRQLPHFQIIAEAKSSSAINVREIIKSMPYLYILG